MRKTEKNTIEEDRGIVCRRCGAVMSKVLETRREDDAVRRRRKCLRCGWCRCSMEKLI